jgi:hypothetical protein
MQSQATSSKKLSTTFLQHRSVQLPTLLLSRQDLLKAKRAETIKELEKKLKLKKRAYATTNPHVYGSTMFKNHVISKSHRQVAKINQSGSGLSSLVPDIQNHTPLKSAKL